MQALNEYGTLVAVVVKHVRDAFVDEQTIAAQWKRLNYIAAPDLARAIDQHDRFIDLLRSAGATVHERPRDPHTTLDSTYVPDAYFTSPTGSLLGTLRKVERAGAPAAPGT